MKGDQKPDGYYANDRADLVALLPRPLGRVLDVGCGVGEVSAKLRESGAAHVAGVEISPAMGEQARGVVDELFIGGIEDAFAHLQGPYDTICCYDVLEHLVDPYDVLRQLVAIAAPGARLHVSVPNARNWRLARDLFLKGTFAYADWGHRDITHLRWFTSRDLAAAVADAGWTNVDVRTPVHDPRRERILRGANALTRGRAEEFLVLQWTLLAYAPR